MADRYTLLVDLAQIGSPGAPGVFVAVEKAKGELVYPVGDDTHETLYPTRAQARTDEGGVARFALLPSRLAGPYRVTVGSYRRTIWMPDDEPGSALDDSQDSVDAGYPRLTVRLWQLPEFDGSASMDPHASLGFMRDDLSNLDADLTDEEKAAIWRKIDPGNVSGGLAGLPAPAAGNRWRWVARSLTGETFTFVLPPLTLSGTSIVWNAARTYAWGNVVRHDGVLYAWLPVEVDATSVGQDPATEAGQAAGWAVLLAPADAAARASAAAAQATADAALPKAGGTMTGALTLRGAPTVDLHAATKKYVDDNAGGAAPGKATNDQVDEVAATGTALSASLTARTALDDAGFLTVRKAARLLQRVLKSASTTLRGVVLLARAEDVAATETDTTRVTTVANVKALLARIGDATARAAAAAAQATADTSRSNVGLLQELTRDLHSNQDATGWALATDAAIDYVRNDDYSSAAFAGNEIDRPEGGWPDYTASSGEGYIFVRVPDGADISDYRALFLDSSGSWSYGGNLFVKEAESPDDATYDYYKVKETTSKDHFGQLLSPVSISVEHYGHASPTHYDGEFRGTFRDGIVDEDALDPALAARINAEPEAGDDSLIEKLYDDMVAGGAAIFSVEGVTITNDANQAYYIRVAAASEFTLGSALFAAASNSAITVDGVRFWTLADGSLRIGSASADKAVVVWKVDDLGALRTALQNAGLVDAVARAAAGAAQDAADDAQADATQALADAATAQATADEGIAEGLEPADNPDLDDYDVGDVLLVGGHLQQVSDAPAANLFAGTAAAYSVGSKNYLITSDPDSTHGLNGRFTANPGGAVGTLSAGVNLQYAELRLEENAYQAAKGSGVASGDTVVARVSRADGQGTAQDITLTYARLSRRPRHHWLSFETTGADALTLRALLQADADWRMEIRQGNAALFTHDTGKHLVEYPIFGVDEFARQIAGAALPKAGGTMTGKIVLDGAPTANLHAATKAYVDDQVGGEATLGVRTESIEFQAVANAITDVELSPIAADPVTVLHGEGDPEIITGLNGNDFTVAAGLYLLRIDGEVDADAVLRFGFDIRDAADDSIIVGPQEKSAYNTQGQYQAFTSTGYWHPTEAVEVNVLLERFGRSCGLRNVVMRFAQLNAQEHIHPHVIEPLEPLDTDEASDGDVVLHDHAFYQRAAASEVTEDGFAGELESWLDGSADWIGTALAASRYGSRGRFISNPDNKVGALTAGGDNPATVGLRLDKAAYETAKGSAVADGDTVWADISDGHNISVTELTYVRTESGGGTDYLAFIAQDADCVLHDLSEGQSWFLRVLSAYDSEQGTSTPLFEHDAETPHFNEYPIKAVDQTARDQAAEARTFARIIQPWEFVEPAGGIGFREVGDFAGQARAEAVTGDIDTDRELVTALRVTEQYGLRRALRIQGTAGYFLRKTSAVTTSGSIQQVAIYLAVQRAGADDRNIARLDLATFTLDQFNAQYAAVGNALQYSDAADVTRPIDMEWTDFSDFDLEEGDVLVFRFVGNAINGNARVKIEIDDLDISLGGGLASRIRSSAIHQDVVLTQAEYDALTVKDAHTRYNIVAG